MFGRNENDVAKIKEIVTRHTDKKVKLRQQELEEFIDYFAYLLINPDQFNRRLVDYLIFYNTERVRYAFKNKLSPVQFMIQRQEQKLSLGPLPNQTVNQLIKMPAESKIGWHYTQL